MANDASVVRLWAPMGNGVKRVGLIALLVVSWARAEWPGLREGMDPKAAFECVGKPLIENKVRGGLFVTWIYDDGGNILFEGGKLRYWQAPKSRRIAAEVPEPVLAQKVGPGPKASDPRQSPVAAKPESSSARPVATMGIAAPASARVASVEPKKRSPG